MITVFVLICWLTFGYLSCKMIKKSYPYQLEEFTVGRLLFYTMIMVFGPLCFPAVFILWVEYSKAGQGLQRWVDRLMDKKIKW